MSTSPTLTTPTKHEMPFLRLDLVLLSVSEGVLQVLLSHRMEAPFQDMLGLPGGVLRIDLDASLEAGAQRVAQERLSRHLPNLSQVAAVGGADRDPRAPWALSVIYRSLVQPDFEAAPGKRVQALEWHKAEDAINAPNLAFDHAKLIQKAVAATRQEIRELRFPTGWMPATFTLAELQQECEGILGSPLDKVTFRRRMELSQTTTAIAGEMRTGAHRPAQLYAFATRPTDPTINP